MRSTAARRMIAAALTTTAIGFSLPAFAADEPQAAQADQASEATVNEDTGAIIVTARRRSETLQQAPLAMTAIQPSQLQGQAALTIGDLQGAAPNVVITSGGTGAAAANISIRGIAFADIEKSFDPAVGVNIDGIYIGTSTGQMLDFFDIGSIEVLRGPQGTLFGRNTIAGVINVNRTKPTGKLGAKLEAELGSFGQFAARGVFNAPLGADLAFKGFFMHVENDGFYKDIGTGKNRGGGTSKNFGASLLFTPSADFSNLLTIDKQIQDFDPVLGGLSRTGDAFAAFLPAEYVNNGVTDGIYDVLTPAPVFGSYSSPGITNEANLTLGSVRITSVTGYRESTDVLQQDYATAGLYLANRDQTYRQFSQELRAAGELFDGFDYVAGLYYFNSRYTLAQTTSVFGGPATLQQTTGWSKSYAAFLDLNWEILPQVRLSGGGRFTRDIKALQTTFNDPSAPAAGFSSPRRSADWNKFTPKIGIDYRPNQDLMVYASWSRGYRSGGFNGRGLTPFAVSLPYDPETVDAYEIGLKSEFFDRKLTVNLAGYYSDYAGIQQTSTVAVPGIALPQTVVTNAAAAKIKGFEADVTIRPVERMTIRGSLGYTDASFRGFVVNQPVALSATLTETRTFDFSGVDMIYAPDVTASINGEYEIPFEGKFSGKVKLNAGYRYLSPYDQQIAADPAIYPTAIAAAPGAVITVPRNDPRLRSDAQNLVDVSISVIFDLNSTTTYRLTGFARNLLDDRGTQTAFTAGAFPTFWGFATARQPRVFGVQMGLEF